MWKFRADWLENLQRRKIYRVVGNWWYKRKVGDSTVKKEVENIE